MLDCFVLKCSALHVGTDARREKRLQQQKMSSLKHLVSFSISSK